MNGQLMRNVAEAIDQLKTPSSYKHRVRSVFRSKDLYLFTEYLGIRDYSKLQAVNMVRSMSGEIIWKARPYWVDNIQLILKRESIRGAWEKVENEKNKGSLFHLFLEIELTEWGRYEISRNSQKSTMGELISPLIDSHLESLVNTYKKK